MSARILCVGLVVAGLCGAALHTETRPAPEPVKVAPKVEPKPDPDCPDGKCPPRRPKPWGDLEAAVGGPVHADGTEIQLDLPVTLHQRNTGGSDGAGLCVFASLRHAGLWADEPVFSGLFEWMKRHPGGSYPAKTDRMVEQFCKEKKLPKPLYIQVENADLGILKAACAAGLMPSVTTMRHSHMISLVHADDRHFVTLDNNLPGKYRWQTPAEFLASYTGGSSKGWAVIPLKPGPPPIPNNAEAREMFPTMLACALALAPASGPELTWDPWPDGSEYALMRGGEQVGSWNVAGGFYRPVEAGVWGPRSSPPIDPPVPTGGVVAEKLTHGRDRYTLSGKEVDKVTAEKAVQDAKIPDLAGKLRVTAIGTPAETAPVIAALKAGPRAADLVLAAYEPTHWHVASVGFKTDGHPTVYVQDSTGAVLHRQDDGSPVELAAAIERLRKPNPNYDPAKDPSKPLSAGGPAGLLVLGGVVAAAYALTRLKKG